MREQCSGNPCILSSSIVDAYASSAPIFDEAPTSGAFFGFGAVELFGGSGSLVQCAHSSRVGRGARWLDPSPRLVKALAGKVSDEAVLISGATLFL